jgi:hypothetical protein
VQPDDHAQEETGKKKRVLQTHFVRSFSQHNVPSFQPFSAGCSRSVFNFPVYTLADALRYV